MLVFRNKKKSGRQQFTLTIEWPVMLLFRTDSYKSETEWVAAILDKSKPSSQSPVIQTSSKSNKLASTGSQLCVDLFVSFFLFFQLLSIILYAPKPWAGCQRHQSY